MTRFKISIIVDRLTGQSEPAEKKYVWSRKMNISKFSVKRPITIIMAVLIVAAIGIISVTSLTTALFPSMNLPYAIVITSYEGASPERVEMMITKTIESTMATVSNIKSIQSVSSEGNSTVILEFNSGTNMDSAMIDMREKLDMIAGYLPSAADNSRIIKINPDMMPILNFSITVDDMDISESTYWIEDKILPRLERIEGVATISISGGAKNQVQVILDETSIKKINDELKEDLAQQAEKEMLEQGTKAGDNTNTDAEMPMLPYQTFISRDMVINILRGQNFAMPSGYIEDDDFIYLVRIGDKLKEIKEIEKLLVFKNENKSIKLSDIAAISMVDAADNTYSKVNGERAITVSIQKQNNFAISDVVSKINEEFDAIEEDFENIDIVVLMDQAEYIDLAVGSVGKNLLYGGILAVLVLILFLRDIKPTFIVGVAIPISLLAAFILIYFLDITLNIVSMGGLALGIGMLVDNSIVVIENIYRIRAKGKGAKYSAVTGAKQVSGAIIASTLTTVSVFLPIVFLQGMTADIFKDMALTISASLIASLVIALTFVPMAASKMLKNKQVKKKTKLFKTVTKGYGKILKLALKNRALVIIITVLLFAGSVYGSLQIGTEYFPETDSGQISVNAKMPLGTSFDDTAAILDEASEIIMEIKDVDTVGASIGGNMMIFGGGPGGSNNSGTISVLLNPDGTEQTSVIEQKIRDELKMLDAEFEVSGQAMDLTALTGSGISVEIRGLEFDMLEILALEVTTIIEKTDGTTEIDNGISKASPALEITVDRDKAIENGLTTAQVFAMVDRAINPQNKAGALALNSRDYDILVIDNDSKTFNIFDVKNIELISPMGTSIKLKDVADVKIESGFSTINRINQERTISVTSALEEGFNIGLVGEKIQEELDDMEIPEGYSIELTGENEEISSALMDLILALAMAVALIYMIMAAQFESLKYPFIVMFAIPLAFTGGFLGLIITSTPVSVVALIGLIVLAGIVVNNGIVLVDYINQLKARGMTSTKAIIKAGKTRLRPIVMTALTTIFALSTLSIGVGRGAEMMQPLAITAIGGLIFSTALTLIIVPVLYASFDKSTEKRAARKTRKMESYDDAVKRLEK